MRIALFAALAQLAAFGVVAEESSPVTDCNSESDCRLEYEYLATQETDPFLFAGNLMNAEQPRWNQYRRALRRFPDVRDCLVPEERNKPEPNLLHIDWSRVGMDREFEVCLFRIGRSLGSVDRMIDWLNYHEFRVFSASRFRSEGYQPSFADDPIFQVEASWSKDYKRELFGDPLLNLFPNASNTIIVQYNDGKLLVGVHAETNSK